MGSYHDGALAKKRAEAVLAHIGEKGPSGDDVAVLVLRLGVFVQSAQTHRIRAEPCALPPAVLLGLSLCLQFLDRFDLVGDVSACTHDQCVCVSWSDLAQEWENAKERRESIGKPSEEDDEQVVDFLKHEIVLLWWKQKAMSMHQRKERNIIWQLH